MRYNIAFYALVTMLLVCCGCCDTNATHVKTNNYNTKIHSQNGDVVTIEKFEFENHIYIYAVGFSRAGIEHDPNCHCHKEQVKAEK